MTTTPTPIDPESLVARILEELRANPPAQELLFHALLTGEFLGMPVRLERVEAKVNAILARLDSLEEGQRSLEEGQHRIEGRVDSIEEVQRNLQDTVRDIQDKVGALVGDTLELKLPGRIIPLLSQKIRLRRAEIVRSPTTTMSREFADAIADAVDAGTLEEWQEDRLGLTDIIIRAQRQSDRSPVWVAVEASSVIHLRDIERVRQSADSLSAVFGQDAIAVVAGNQIEPAESRQADEASVVVLIIE